ncbi:hypothetical protein [Protaetiibacter intestinalis]|nr:hypothetical protein [Protaetiibacter intestinalis]
MNWLFGIAAGVGIAGIVVVGVFSAGLDVGARAQGMMWGTPVTLTAVALGLWAYSAAFIAQLKRLQRSTDGVVLLCQRLTSLADGLVRVQGVEPPARPNLTGYFVLRVTSVAIEIWSTSRLLASFPAESVREVRVLTEGVAKPRIVVFAAAASGAPSQLEFVVGKSRWELWPERSPSRLESLRSEIEKLVSSAGSIEAN